MTSRHATQKASLGDILQCKLDDPEAFHLRVTTWWHSGLQVECNRGMPP